LAELAIAPTTYRGLFASSFQQSQKHYLWNRKKEKYKLLTKFWLSFLHMIFYLYECNPSAPVVSVYPILYYTILWSVSATETLQKHFRNPSNSSFLLMKPLQFDSFCFRNSPETHQKLTRNTIDLAKIVWIRAMKPLAQKIKIEVESDDDEMITEIPVDIRRQISFEQLDSLISNNIATKTEFRIWNAMKKAFIQNTSNFSL